MLRFQEIRLSGWKLLAFAAVGTVVLLIISTLVVWLALALLVVMGLFAFHAVYLPRLSTRLGLSTLSASALLLPLTVLLVWAVVRSPAAAALYGTGLWLLGVVGPQLAIRHVTRQIARGFSDMGGQRPTNADRAPGRLLKPVSCRQCGWAKYIDPTLAPGTCPRCDLPLTPGREST